MGFDEVAAMERHAALVTGAASGIGRATALGLARRGIDLVLLDLDESGLGVLADDIQALGARALAQRADVSVASEVTRAFDRAADAFGPHLEIVVNCAGIVYVGPITEMTEEDWDRVISVNLKSVFLCCKMAIPVMRRARYGRIVNVSSVGARNGGMITGANYAASKGGVWSFTKALARELASDGITVNCVMPGVIDTPMTQGHDPRRMAALAQAIPLGRLGRAEDVAGAILFLLSEQAGYITGATLDVNGGIRMD